MEDGIWQQRQRSSHVIRDHLLSIVHPQAVLLTLSFVIDGEAPRRREQRS